jgi:hypothetical protein
VVEWSLTPSLLAGWPAREARAERGDTIAVHALLSRIEQEALLAETLALVRSRCRADLTAFCDVFGERRPGADGPA